MVPGLMLLAVLLDVASIAVAPQESNALTPPVLLTAEQDHQRTMNLLNIKSLRPGADGRNPQAANAANYDETKGDCALCAAKDEPFVFCLCKIVM